jgi:hypothetical protein
MGERVKVGEAARNALSQTRKGAVIVASCKPIKKDDDNPPHERAKREYIDILDDDEDAGRLWQAQADLRRPGRPVKLGPSWRLDEGQHGQRPAGDGGAMCAPARCQQERRQELAVDQPRGNLGPRAGR